MDVRFLTHTDKTAVFEVRDCDLALVNSLRRVIIAEVPYVSLAQDGFVCRRNTCVMHNQFLWHRITLAPMHLSRGEADAYIPGSIGVSLQADNREGASPVDVTSADLRVTLHDQPHPDSARLYPADAVTGDHVLLTVLKPGEAIDISGTAVKGVAGEHASFAVTSKCAFRPLLDDDIVTKMRADVPDGDLQALNRFEHIDRKRAWKPGPDGNPRDFEFTVVSECGMSALDIVQSALDVLERKCATAKASLHPGRVPQLEVAGEGDTLGNLLQSTAMDELVGDGKPISFVGYYCPHPLEKRVVFRVASPDPQAAFQSMKDAALARVKDLKHLVSEAAARKEAA